MPQGLAAVTFIHPDPGEETEPSSGWIYPDCVTHPVSSIQTWIREASLHGVQIPWHHPRQAWWLLARDPARLPSDEGKRLLHGAVL